MGNKLLCAILLAAAALAQTQTDAQKPASVSGIVTNTLTGAPILRAHVRLTGSGPSSSSVSTVQGQTTYNYSGPQAYGAMTDAEGKFSILQIPPGNYTVSVDRVGFVVPRNVATAGVRLTAGENRDSLKLLLTPTGAILGRVVDADGQPVQNANVSAESSGTSASSSTDDRGQYRIGGLPPGKYRVVAAPLNLPFPPEVRTDGSKDYHNSPTYYPGVLRSREATRVELNSGADVSNVDIRLVRTPIVIVRGMVSGIPPGSKNVNVQVGRPTGNGYSTQSGNNVKSDGTFEIWRLDPGKYTLIASQGGFNGTQRLQSAPLDIEVTDANIEHLELRMVPQFDVSGRIRFDDEEARQPPSPPARPGQQPQNSSRPRTRTVQLRAPAGVPMGSTAGSFAVSADDTFTIERLQPGQYRLGLWANAYVRSVRVGDVEMEGDVLDLRNGAGGPVTVTVGSASAEISGTVTDSKGPVAGVRVGLLSDPPDQLQRQWTTDASGNYTLNQLPPGRYRLLLLEDDMNLGQMMRANMEDYDDIAVTIDLHPGEKLTKELRKK